MQPGMDQFQFLVLNTEATWKQGLPVHIDITDEGLKIQETRNYIKEAVTKGGLFPGRPEIIDFTAGPCCLLYFLDSTGSLWVYDLMQKRAEPVDCIWSLFSRPESIAYSPGTIFIADKAQRKIFALAEINWQIRWIASSKNDNFIPVTVRAAQNGSLYALTPYDSQEGGSGNAGGMMSVPAGGRAAIVKFDQSGKLVDDFDLKVELSSATETGSLNEAVDFNIAQDGTLFVLEAAGKKVSKFLPSGIKVWENDQWSTFPELPCGIGVDGAGNLFIGEGRSQPGESENGHFLHKFSPTGKFLGMVPSFQGYAGKLQIDQNERMYIYDQESLEITILNPEQNPLPNGIYFSRAFEATSPETRWHKLVLDAQIPNNTQVKVSYLIANEKEFIINGNKINLDDQMTCPVGFSDGDLEARADVLNSLYWSAALLNPKDALIHAQPGRYLWLRIELTGSQGKTPLLKSIRAYFPRTSYLRYLPAVYQENEQSRDFLERFLSLFETFFSQMEVQIGHIERFFDADFVRGDFLRWLGAWLAIAVDENWPEDKLRLLIKKAPGLFKIRGTRKGIEAMIKVYTGDKPFIVEQFQLKCAEAGEEFQELLIKLYGEDPYSFCVLLKPFQVKKENEGQAVRRIIDSEKPAYIKAKVVALQPWIYLDMHTYLGVNTYLTKPSLRLDIGSIMPRDTVLEDVDEAGQIERRSKLGWDTSLT
ncbi:MAG: Phage tail protein (Tail_P2_I) [Pelotomaculum sp. PtaB.Bin104]|nr:MAG: Phage tail protein (Tail_P2_I) [Pelotomaculum sp. PtaB.Bin104]